MITNWFYSLTLGQAIGVVFFGMILSASTTFMACEFISKFYRWALREYRLSKFPDEFMFKDDPYAILAYPINEMKDDIHVEHAKSVLGRRAAMTTLHQSNYTCFNCSDQQNCPFSFDAYNMDGDCLMTK